MLNAYITQVQQLLNNPNATSALYSTTNLTNFINMARGQLAGETECIRVLGSLALSSSQQVYPFSSITLSSVSGIAGVFNVRGISWAASSTPTYLTPRPFPYFMAYYLNNSGISNGPPMEYSQYAQGEGGSLYFNPTPDASYTVYPDCVCVPIALVDDTTVEAIPYPYTDAVQYFAAYLAYTSAQRSQDAATMFQLYKLFAGRARQMSNGEVFPEQYAQSPAAIAVPTPQVPGGNG